MVISRNSHAGYFKYHRITIKMLWGFHRCHVGIFFLFFWDKLTVKLLIFLDISWDKNSDILFLIFLGIRILSSDFWMLFSHEFGGRILKTQKYWDFFKSLTSLKFLLVQVTMVTMDPVWLDPVWQKKQCFQWTWRCEKPLPGLVKHTQNDGKIHHFIAG